MAVSNFMASTNKNANLLFLFSLTVLCTLSYFIGVSHHGGAPITTTLSVSTPLPCINSTDLDFTVRHSAESAISSIAMTASIINIPPCDSKYSEYTPCEDLVRSLRFPRKRLMYRERHCPAPGEGLKCRIPAPFGYKVSVRWPESRDSVWFANVPHKELTVEKAGQNWVRFKGNRFSFPGGGTMFSKGADAYIDDIGNVVNFTEGSIRTAIDTGCGVASWGAYLLKRNVLTMSFAPKDTHEAQVQFALERGLPAIIGILASKRLPYPSRSFDMAHCSRCLIPWGQYDGIFLIEIDRILRPGGYWILSGPPINWERHSRGWKRSIEDLKGEQASIETVAKNLCWKIVYKREDIAIWQKPTNHIHCKINRRIFKTLPFCNVQQDPDMAWYTEMETCLTPLPETLKGANIKEVAGGELQKWPQRLNSVPPRVKSGSMKGISEDIFIENSDMWETRVAHYKSLDNQLAEKGRYRNLLDMNSFLGGFAAALIDDPVWVMNVVPVEAEINTLGAIYERGLIGTYQNWCEAMSTYPRTYDFIHADTIFTLYMGRCQMEDILLEMDRVLRPEGSAILRDEVDVLLKVKNILDGMQWESKIMDNEDGALEREKILVATKLYWTTPNQKSSQHIL